MDTDRSELTAEKETLFVPLYSKPWKVAASIPSCATHRRGHPGERGLGFAASHPPRNSQLTLTMRAKQRDDGGVDFLARRPDAAVLHLGCGLDSRFVRVGEPAVPWYDVDYPEVIALRRRYYTETMTYHLLGSSVIDLAWLDRVAHVGPTMVIAEGLLMYLTSEQVKALFLAIQMRFPGSGSPSMPLAPSRRAYQASPAHAQDRRRDLLGHRRSHEIDTWAPGIRLLRSGLSRLGGYPAPGQR